MQLIINDTDLTKLKPATRQDLLSTFFGTGASAPGAQNAEGFDWEEVADLDTDEMDEFMQGCSEQTVAGLKIIAEHGPVIAADLLEKAGISNYGHFQGSVTKRTRTITGDKHAFLFAWDDWSSDENEERGFGHYAVTETTFRSLRAYFELD